MTGLDPEARDPPAPSVQRSQAAAQRAAWGAVVGRVVATAGKMALGCALIVIVLVSAWG